MQDRSAIKTRDDLSADSLLSYIADEFMERRQRGEQPGVEEFVERYPQIADVLRQVIPALDVLPSLSSSRAGTEADPRGIRGANGDDGQADPTSALGRLGEYRIVREIGRGGMGIVYEAEQTSLGRRVALKVLPFAAVLDAKQLQRFKNEAMAAASLDHPNIVHVHSVGCEQGVHFYAMQFIEGQTLATSLFARRIIARSFGWAR